MKTVSKEESGECFASMHLRLFSSLSLSLSLSRSSIRYRVRVIHLFLSLSLSLSLSLLLSMSQLNAGVVVAVGPGRPSPMDGKIIPNGTSSSKNEPRVITHTPLAPQASKPEIKSYSRSLAVKPCVSTKVRKRKSSSYSETRRFSGYYRTNNTKSTRTA